jgi:hypothetical protein
MKTETLAAALSGTILVLASKTGPTSYTLQEKTMASDLKREMQRLWTGHVVTMRDFIVAAAADAPGKEEAKARLEKNRQEIASIVSTYYGEAAAEAFNRLLQLQIEIATEPARAMQSSGAMADFMSDMLLTQFSNRFSFRGSR